MLLPSSVFSFWQSTVHFCGSPLFLALIYTLLRPSWFMHVRLLYFIVVNYPANDNCRGDTQIMLTRHSRTSEYPLMIIVISLRYILHKKKTKYKYCSLFNFWWEHFRFRFAFQHIHIHIRFEWIEFIQVGDLVMAIYDGDDFGSTRLG